MDPEENHPDRQRDAKATGASGGPGSGRLRADARRNRERILAAARDVFVDLGPDAPLDEVASRAGVGIATLYRRFPDRRALTAAVVLDVIGRSTEEAELALTEESDTFAALARYLHRSLDLRVSAVMPALLGRTSFDDEEIGRARERSTALLQRLIDRAQEAGTLRPDVTFVDIGVSLVRLARPLPGPLPRPLADALAHRHLELLLAGLRVPGGRHDPLPGPALTLVDLRARATPPAQPSVPDADVPTARQS